MKTVIFKTSKDWGALIARTTLGLVLLPHGAQKMLGLFGGFGFSGTMDFFTNTLQLPWLVSFLIIVIEFFGSLLLLAGWAGRLWSLSIIILFLGIIVTSHAEHGFFMNWMGNQKGEGYEFHLLIVGLALIVLVNGSGQYSVDERWMQWNARDKQYRCSGT